MKFVLLVLAINLFRFGSAINCSIVPKHYEELNCVPNSFDENHCPLSFDCSSFEERDKDRCHYNGTIIDIHKELHNGEIEESCTINCVCRKDHDDNVAKFNCAHIDCPDFFDNDLHENCIEQYTVGSCCPQSRVCGMDLKKLAKCEFNGKEYYEGQQIDTENSCYSCLCGEGFENNPVESNKHCKKVNCLIDLHYSTKFYDGCIPVYYKNENCCPIGFRCPDPETTVIQNNNKTRAVTETLLQCSFGDLKLSVGDSLSLEQDDECTLCTCKFPPHPTCINSC